MYTRQAQPTGLGDAIRHGTGLGDGRGVVVALGDSIIERPHHIRHGIVGRLIEAYGDGEVSAVIAVHEVGDDEVQRYGIVVGDERAAVIEVSDVIEKPAAAAVSSRLAVAARYVLGPAVFDALRATPPDPSGEVQLADALRAVIAAGGRVVALRLAAGERRHDIGTIESYCAAFLEYALTDSRFGPALRDRARALLDGSG
jgi:UTP--glucose-1-phosphate uridylyltransferase